MQALWAIIVSPAASVFCGLACLLSLVLRGRHRDLTGKTAHGKIAMAVLQSAACYTMLTTIAGHWFLKIQLSETIQAGFGNDRFAWLLLGLSVDSIGRIYGLFDPD